MGEIVLLLTFVSQSMSRRYVGASASSFTHDESRLEAASVLLHFASKARLI